jgi:anti-sigma regulatory factor (Ser/Thr protein kinase)
VTVTVEDDGVPFNPLEATEPDLDRPLEERSIGGLGIHLVKNLMDDVEYRREAGRNYLVMRKRVPAGT